MVSLGFPAGACLFVLLIFTVAMALTNRRGLSLRETFQIYVEAVQASDLDLLFTTVTDSADFFFLTADGRKLDRDQYHEFHREWFAETGWEMPVELVMLKEGQHYGYTTAIFYYRAQTPAEKVYNLESYFTLIFRKEDGMWKVVADICSPISRYMTVPDSDTKYDMDQEYLLRMIRERRTVRRFKKDPVPEVHIRRILDAGRYAPTAGNVQPWEFVVIRDRARLDELAGRLGAHWEDRITARSDLERDKRNEYIDQGKQAITDAMTAPVYVIVFVDTTTYPEYAAWDGCLAVGNLMLAARSLGYGTGFFTTYFSEEVIKPFVNAGDHLQLICATPVGIPEEWPQALPKHDLDRFIVYDRFE
jgi:nitroreductase/ketosteroid isomerase-like protein